jgi:hypothetical protein
VGGCKTWHKCGNHSAMNTEEAYIIARDATGITVAEYETMHGLPRYTIFPHIEHVTKYSDIGYFMYPREK